MLALLLLMVVVVAASRWMPCTDIDTCSANLVHVKGKKMKKKAGNDSRPKKQTSRSFENNVVI